MLFQNQGKFISFDDLDKIVVSNIDILGIGKNKLEKDFPNNQFTLKGYCTPHRLNITE